MVVRVSHPNTPTKLIDLGPAHGQMLPLHAMRKTIDDLPALVPHGKSRIVDSRSPR